ncbi:MAG: glutathione S-transferase family protein [Solirubrobacterales bacterium]
MKARLYCIPGSHPSMAGRLMLERKGIPYKRTDVMPVLSRVITRAVGFSGNRVPALKIDGRKVQGTGAIARELDRIQPEPQLVPTDPAELKKVEEVEAFGDDELQQIARRTLWNVLKRDKAPLRSYSEGARLGIPIGLAVKTAGPIVATAGRMNNADDETVRASLAALPGALDRIDAWIAEGTIGGESPNIGDYQVAPSLRLLMTLEDLRPHMENRPAGRLAIRVVPDFPGQVPAGAVPAEWLEPLGTASRPA